MAANILKKATSPILCAQLCTVRNSTAEKKLFAVHSCTPLDCKTRPVLNPSSFFPLGARLLTECLQHVNK